MEDCITVHNTVRSDNCPLCGSRHIRMLGRASYRDPLHFSSAMIRITDVPELWYCNSCRSGFTQNIFDPEEMTRLYSIGNSTDRWSNAPFDQDKTASLIEFVDKRVTQNMKVLDIGCNTGQLLDFVRRKGCRTFGVEMSRTAIDVCKAKGHEIFDNIEAASVQAPYDVIFLFDVIEHVHDIPGFLGRCSAMLSEAGSIVCLTGDINCISRKLSGSRWWYAGYPEHIRFPSLRFFRSLPQLKLIDMRFVVNSIGYYTPLREMLRRVWHATRSGSYNGLPSLGNDHIIVELRKKDVVAPYRDPRWRFPVEGSVPAELRSCPACRADLDPDPHLAGMFDDRYGYPGLFSLMTCPHCGQIETNPPLDEDALPALYGNYYPRSSIDVEGLTHQVGRPGSIRARIRRWWDGSNNQGQYYTRPGTKILDYGCGSGLSLLEAKALGGEAYGIEADPNVARVARHYRLNIHIGRMTQETFPGVRFDLIVLNQVIEHVPDPVQLLGALMSRLSEKGKIVMSFPNTGSIYRRIFGRQWINWHIPYHLHHFNRKSFMLFAARLGLSVLELRTVTPNLWTVLQFRTLGQNVDNGRPNPMWGRSDDKTSTYNLRDMQKTMPSRQGLIGRIKIYVKRLTLLSIAAFIGIANRIIDLLGQGDSFLVVLQPKVREEL